MAKLRIHYGRLLLIGIFWIPVYFIVLNQIGFHLFLFRPLAIKDWESQLHAFQSGEWIISSGADWAKFSFIILVFPMMIVGWIMLYRFRWSRLLPKSFKEHQAQRQPFKLGSVRRTFEPTKLRVQSSAILSVPIGNAASQSVPPSNAGSAAPASVTPAATTAAAPTAPAPQGGQPQSVYADEAEVQRMMVMTASVKADFFPHVILDGLYASFALSTEKLAAVVRVINQPDSVWAVDTEVPPEESDWFEQTSVLATPAKDIISIAKNLRENEPNSIATPIILLMSGKLLNVEETMAYFEKNGMMLLRLEEAEADEVPLFSDFLNEYFSAPRTEGTPS